MKLRTRRHGLTRASDSMRMRARRERVNAQLRAENQRREQELFAAMAAAGKTPA